MTCAISAVTRPSLSVCSGLLRETDVLESCLTLLESKGISSLISMRHQCWLSYTCIYIYIYINTQRFTCGENLLRCGNSCSHFYYYNPIHMVNTSIQVFPGRLSPSESSRTTPVDSSRGESSHTTLVDYSSELFPGRPVYCTLHQGLGSPPNSLPRLRETPYDTRGLPCSYHVDISPIQKG